MLSFLINLYCVLSMFPDLEKVMILGYFILICSFHSAQYSQRMSMLFCNPLADVESSKRSSANIIIFITLSFICMGSADCSFKYFGISLVDIEEESAQVITLFYTYLAVIWLRNYFVMDKAVGCV